MNLIDTDDDDDDDDDDIANYTVCSATDDSKFELPSVIALEHDPFKIWDNISNDFKSHESESESNTIGYNYEINSLKPTTIEFSARPFIMERMYSMEWYFSTAWYKDRIGIARTMIEYDEDPIISTERVSIDSPLSGASSETSSIISHLDINENSRLNLAHGGPSFKASNKALSIFKGTFGNNDESRSEDEKYEHNAATRQSIIFKDALSDSTISEIGSINF